MRKYIPILAFLPLLCACTSQWDMQGVDPKDYYAQHPIKNRVESHDASVKAHFAVGASALSDSESDRVHMALHGISPMAVQSIRVRMAAADLHDEPRKTWITKWLRHQGFAADGLEFEASDLLRRGEARIDVAYMTVTAPDCPDWRTSPVTTYSNTMQGNFACANEVNFGMMVADPHDLMRGTGDVSPSTERNSKIIDNYRSGKDLTSSSSGNSGGESGGGSNGNGPAPGMVPQSSGSSETP